MRVEIDNTPPKKEKRLDAICSFCGLVQKLNEDVVFVEAPKKPGAEVVAICQHCVVEATRLAKGA